MIELVGARNDEKLIRLGFLVPLTKKVHLREMPMCGQCGTYFSEEGFLTAHGDLYHANDPEAIRVNFPMDAMAGLHVSRDTNITGHIGVDVTGDAAMAKVELDYPNAVLTDYFTLLKVDGKWMIMNKIFNTQPKR